MLSLSEKILDKEEFSSGDERSLYAFVDEKLLSLLTARLFNNPKYFASGMKFNSTTFTADTVYDADNASEDELMEIEYSGYLERYVWDGDSLYDKIRDDFCMVIGEELLKVPIFSEALRNYAAEGKSMEESFNAFYADFPSLVYHCLINSGILPEEADGLSKALNNALPALEEYIYNFFSWDPEFETFQMSVWVYESKAIGKFLTENPKGKKADKLRKAIEGLSFLKTGMYEGVWYGAEWIGYTCDSYEEFSPTCAITTHDIANIQIIMELLPYFTKKFNKKEGKS